MRSGAGRGFAGSFFSSLALLASLGTPAAAAPLGKVAVLDIQTTGVDPKLVGILTEVLTAETQSSGMFDAVIAGRDVAAMIGFEEQRTLVGCNDERCLAEIGGALGVDRLLASHVGKVGSSFVVNLKLINIRDAMTERRTYETVKADEDVLIETIQASLRKLLGTAEARVEQAAPAKAPPAASHGGAAGASSGGSAVASSGASSSSPATTPVMEPAARSNVLPWVLVGVGVAGAATGTIFGVMAKGYRDRAADPAFVGAQLEIDPGKRSATIANVGFAVGVAGVAAGIVWLLLGGGEDAVSAAAGSGSGAAALAW